MFIHIQDSYILCTCENQIFYFESLKAKTFPDFLAEAKKRTGNNDNILPRKIIRQIPVGSRLIPVLNIPMLLPLANENWSVTTYD